MRYNTFGKIAFFIGIGIAAIVLWYISLFRPQRNALKEMGEQQKSIQTQYNRLLENYSLAMMGSAKKLEISKKCLDILENLPYKEDIATALSQVIEIGQGKGIRIISINPHDISLSKDQDMQMESQLEKIYIDITLEGSFINMGEYLFDLVNLPFFAGYSKIGIKTSEEIYPKTKAQITCILLFLNDVT